MMAFILFNAQKSWSPQGIDPYSSGSLVAECAFGYCRAFPHREIDLLID
jgi:hypothetical protein